LKGLDLITDLVDLYKAVENISLRQDESRFMKKFTEKLENLYFEILHFLAKAARYFDLDTAQRLARNIPKIDDWDNELNKIKSSDEACQKFVNEFHWQEQRTDMKVITNLMQQQACATKKLLKEFSLQSDQSREIILWVSNVDVESDHSRVRRTLGAHYQNSGQWLRSRYRSWIASTGKPTFWLCGSGL
jgi:hypothetical protein